MNDFALSAGPDYAIGVRNEWRRGVISENGKARPDHVLLDAATRRAGVVEWNSISLTPARARKVAAALLKAAAEAER